MSRILRPFQLAGAIAVFATFLTVVAVSWAAISTYELVTGR